MYLVQVHHAVRRCSWRKLHGCTSTCANQHRHAFPSVNTRSLETCSPFCFTFSKGTTRSDNNLGTPLPCAVCCCCCGGCCYNMDDRCCISSLTPGGNCGTSSCGCDIASARVVKAMSQVPAVAVVAAAAVQVNAWSPALKWLSILSTSLWARSHATHWLPALWRVALQTVDMINSCPVAQHVQTTYRCRCLLRLFTHTCTSWLSAHVPEVRMNRTTVIRR